MVARYRCDIKSCNICCHSCLHHNQNDEIKKQLVIKMPTVGKTKYGYDKKGMAKAKKAAAKTGQKLKMSNKRNTK